MNYKFFTNSQKAWKAMFEAISSAQKSIYLEMYIFENDVEEFDFFHLLEEKAKNGIRIRLILDSFGSARFPADALAALTLAGAEVLSLSHLFYRMHRKILVVDESIAFIGGVNIHRTSRFWNDLMVRIKGSLVKKVAESFAKAYIKAGGKDPFVLARSNKTISAVENTGIVEHYPIRKKFYFKKIYKKYLSEAKTSITLITPYFMPQRWLSSALHHAVLRGVDVKVLVPKNTDHFITDRVNYFYIYKLSKLGIKFYMEKNMNHAKAIIIDDTEAMIGSQNLDFLSFDFNSEVGIFFKEKETVLKLSQIAEEWKEGAILFDYNAEKPRWFDYILSPLISIFSRIF